MALTDTRIRTLKPKSGKTERLVAGGNGLYIRVRLGGEMTRTWQFRRKEGDRTQLARLGTYPALSIKEARLKAAEQDTKKEDDQPDGGRGGREVAEGTHRPPSPQGRAGAGLRRSRHHSSPRQSARPRH